MNQIAYKKGYKYQLVEDYYDTLPIKGYSATSDFISLFKDGTLSIKRGYAWDGPSGPTIDTDTFMRASLVHDAGYQLIRQGKLPGHLRNKFDQELRADCREDGMCFLRAWYVYRAVHRAAGPAADPKNKKKVYYAP